MSATQKEKGFTLLELIVVVAIVGILAAMVIPQLKPAPKKAREAVLKSDLHVMREALDQYWADKQHYPDSLDALVEEGYLRKIPVDPFTNASSTWKLIYADAQADNATAEETASASPGIWDVKSSSNETALNGESVSEW